MYELYDTFNNKTISRHRSIKTAVNANASLQRRVKKHNPRCYIPTHILDRDGRAIVSGHPEYDLVWEAELDLVRDAI